MAMDFWQAQRRARKATAIYLTLFIVITVVMAIAVEFVYRHFDLEYQSQFPILGLIFIGVTCGAAAIQYSMYSSFGGSYVAESVGARLVNPDTRDPRERMLLNIVQETAIASGLPVPPVYLIPAQAINAFAAGLTPENAAIAITEGSLHKLSRDEIQGVIAHEFGHVSNGDMKISLRLAAMLMGFFFLLYFGLRIIRIASFSRSSRKGGNPIMIAALVFLAAGAITWVAGSILKASVSRQREYLADASSVQFTRNPEGLANALRKIANETTQDMPKEGMAISHMYLDNHLGFSSLFATHPPLEKRIEAIEGKATYSSKRSV